jgi:hypothetical protein
MSKNSRQTIAPKPFNTKELCESHWKKLEFYTKKEEVLVRYLTSKVLFTKEVVSDEEYIVLFLAFERWSEKIAIHGIRNSKTYDLYLFRSLYQSLENLRKLTPDQRSELRLKYYSFYRGSTFSARFYYSVKGQIQKIYDLRVKTRFPQQFPPKAFVDKGYGDHGTAKNLAIDGSPSWQEVASVHSEDNLPGLTEKKQRYFESIRVHSSQILRI